LSKKKLVSLYHYWWRKRVNWHALPRWQQLKQAGRFNLRAQSAEERRRLLALFRAAHPHLAEEIEDFTEEWCPPNLASKVLVRGESFLLTYQGDWGIIPVSGLDAGTVMRAMRLMTNERARQVVQAELGRSCPSQAPDPASAWQRADPDAALKSVDIVAEAARSHPRTAACVEALLQRLATFRERRKVVYDAWAAEVCGRSWLEAGQVRVHLHLALCLRAGSREPVNMENERVMDTLPFLTTPALGQGARARNASAALYYVQAPKVGVVRQGGSHEPHVDYSVMPAWIYRLLGSGKLLFSAARAEMVRSPQGLPRHLESLERWQRERVDRCIVEVSSEFAQRFADLRMPWKEYAMVTMWQQQYRQRRVRYSFLVLDGPSRMGKTQFARSLCQAPGQVLEINMAGGAKVDMRAYDALVHELLLFDECEPGAVLENKKLFQAGGGQVSLQTSATNLHAFAVCVAEKRFVVCSNNWAANLALLPWEDTEWLRANSYYLHVTEPMWRNALPVRGGPY